jgi:hypothetical protein
MLIFLKEKGTGWPHTGSCINNTNDISSLLGIQRSSIEQLRYYFFWNKPVDGVDMNEQKPRRLDLPFHRPPFLI